MSSSDRYVLTIEDMKPVDRDAGLVVEVFHLQGQHDQQSHAGGRAVNTGGDTRRGNPDDFGTDRKIQTHTPRGGGRSYGFDIEDADGYLIERIGLTDREGLWTEEQAQQAISGLADAWMLAPTGDGRGRGSEAPLISVMSAPAAVTMLVEKGMRQESAQRVIENTYGFIVSNDPDNIYFVAGAERPEPDTSLWMPSSQSVDPERYTAVHEYAHIRAARGEDTKSQMNNAKGASLGTPWASMSEYGKTDIVEAHAETFAEIVLTGGRTDNRVAQIWNAWFGWTRDLEDTPIPAIAAAAGDNDELPWLIGEGPTGPVYVYEDGRVDMAVEVFHLQGEHDQQSHAGGRGGHSLPSGAPAITEENGWTFNDHPQWPQWSHQRWGVLDAADVEAGRDSMDMGEFMEVAKLKNGKFIRLSVNSSRFTRTQTTEWGPEGEEVFKPGSIVEAYEVHSPEFWRTVGRRNEIGMIGTYSDRGDGDDKAGEIIRVDVDGDWQRQGVATEMWKFAKKHIPNVRHSRALTDDGRAWNDYLDAEGLAVQTFHLQGQHDQSTHGNRGGARNGTSLDEGTSNRSYGTEGRRYQNAIVRMLNDGKGPPGIDMPDDVRAGLIKRAENAETFEELLDVTQEAEKYPKTQGTYALYRHPSAGNVSSVVQGQLEEATDVKPEVSSHKIAPSPLVLPENYEPPSTDEIAEMAKALRDKESWTYFQRRNDGLDPLDVMETREQMREAGGHQAVIAELAHGWTELDRAGIAEMRQKFVDGDPAAQEVVRIISSAPVADVPLFRGLAPTKEVWEQFSRLEVGDEIPNWGVSGFTDSPGVAERFAGGGFGEYADGVIITLPAGTTPALRIRALSAVPNEGEWLTSSNFRIVSIQEVSGTSIDRDGDETTRTGIRVVVEPTTVASPGDEINTDLLPPSYG